MFLGIGLRHKRSAMIGLCLLLGLTFFQNCNTRVTHTGNGVAGGANTELSTSASPGSPTPPKSSGNGVGYDGKVYVDAEPNMTCSDGTNVVSSIGIAANGNASLLRENCQQLTPPRPLAPSSYSMVNAGTLNYRENLYTYSPVLSTAPPPTVVGGGAYLVCQMGRIPFTSIRKISVWLDDCSQGFCQTQVAIEDQMGATAAVRRSEVYAATVQSSGSPRWTISFGAVGTPESLRMLVNADYTSSLTFNLLMDGIVSFQVNANSGVVCTPGPGWSAFAL